MQQVDLINTSTFKILPKSGKNKTPTIGNL